MMVQIPYTNITLVAMLDAIPFNNRTFPAVKSPKEKLLNFPYSALSAASGDLNSIIGIVARPGSARKIQL